MELVGGKKFWLSILRRGERACTAECCVCNIRAPLWNSTLVSGVQTGYSEPERALRTMSNRQVLSLENTTTCKDVYVGEKTYKTVITMLY
jgi:hypothetical protein